jgi:hypothetical protein
MIDQGSITLFLRSTASKYFLNNEMLPASRQPTPSTPTSCAWTHAYLAIAMPSPENRK